MCTQQTVLINQHDSCLSALTRIAEIRPQHQTHVCKRETKCVGHAIRIDYMRMRLCVRVCECTCDRIVFALLDAHFPIRLTHFSRSEQMVNMGSCLSVPFVEYVRSTSDGRCQNCHNRGHGRNKSHPKCTVQ